MSFYGTGADARAANTRRPWWAFGEGADWYRNIIASGGATIRQDGSEHHLVDPIAIDPDSADSPFPGWQRPVFRALGIRRFLFLKGQ